MTPLFYVSHEGGRWLPWRGGEVSDDDLAEHDPDRAIINGRAVFALAFEPPFGKRDYKAWDCIHGWSGC